MNKLALAVSFSALAASAFAWEKKSAPIMTPWAEKVTADNVLPEYPRPQMVRAEWMNLNGVWEFEFTRGITNRIPASEWKGCDRAIFDKVEPGKKLPLEILVPFPIESALSGVMERAEYMKYRRTFKLPSNWGGKRVRLNFDAVDWKCEVYVNGKLVGGHEGGYDAFFFDITSALKGGENELIVSVYDPTDNGTQPVGKQRNEPEGYWYTANSGIWQTVWLEPVEEGAATSLKLVPHVSDGYLGATVFAPELLQTVELKAFDGDREIASASGTANREIRLPMPKDMKLWSPDTPFLYDLRITVRRGRRVVDEITSYFGMRELGKKTIDGIMRPTLNGAFVFQAGTLDQGYWPDGNLRAPTDEALKSDIVKHKELGFNLIRKHIKVEPQRWFYWCDKLGVLVWQDMPSMHTHAVYTRKESPERRTFRANADEKKLFEGELKEMIDEHVSSPSVVCWILFNEGWGIYDKREVKRLSDWLSAYDPSRWVNDSTGLPNEHASGDVYDVHIYTGPSAGVCEPTSFNALGEYGGIGLNVKKHTWFDRGGWSYGEANKDQKQLNERYLAMQDELFNNMYFPGLSAAMYTQISDVEGETNGILTYDRKVCKFDETALKKAHDRVVEGSKKLARITDANAGVKLAAPAVVRGGSDVSFAFAKAEGASESLLTAATAEAKLAVPRALAAEAGIAMRVTDEGGYLFGLRGDGTLFIRGFGRLFGDAAPVVEKKTDLKGTVDFKACAYGGRLAVFAGNEALALKNAKLAFGRCGVFAKGDDATFAEFKVSNPAHLIRWINGPVKYWVTRDEKREVVGPDGKKTKVPEFRVVVDCNAKEASDAYWVLEKGLSDKSGVSMRNMGHPLCYLAIDSDGFCNLIENDGSADFAKRATWFVRPGNEVKECTSFESAARPGEFLRTRGRLKVEGRETSGFRLDSTFELL